MKTITTKPADLNTMEWKVLRELFSSSDGNGHDFGFTDDVRCVTPKQSSGYISSLSKKGYIITYGAERVNSSIVYQFTLTQRSASVFGVSITDDSI